MSGLDEQFYRCGCNRSYGWFVRDRTDKVLGWLLSSNSPKYERKKARGIALVHLNNGMADIWFDKYRERIFYFNCRACGAILRNEGGINRLISFIKRNWDDRTVRGSKRRKR